MYTFSHPHQISRDVTLQFFLLSSVLSIPASLQHHFCQHGKYCYLSSYLEKTSVLTPCLPLANPSKSCLCLCLQFLSSSFLFNPFQLGFTTPLKLPLSRSQMSFEWLYPMVTSLYSSNLARCRHLTELFPKYFLHLPFRTSPLLILFYLSTAFYLPVLSLVGVPELSPRTPSLSALRNHSQCPSCKFLAGKMTLECMCPVQPSPLNSRLLPSCLFHISAWPAGPALQTCHNKVWQTEWLE